MAISHGHMATDEQDLYEELIILISSSQRSVKGFNLHSSNVCCYIFLPTDEHSTFCNRAQVFHPCSASQCLDVISTFTSSVSRSIATKERKCFTIFPDRDISPQELGQDQPAQTWRKAPAKALDEIKTLIVSR